MVPTVRCSPMTRLQKRVLWDNLHLANWMSTSHCYPLKERVSTPHLEHPRWFRIPQPGVAHWLVDHSHCTEWYPRPRAAQESSNTAFSPPTQTADLTDLIKPWAGSMEGGAAISPCIQELRVQRRVHRLHNIVHSEGRHRAFSISLSLAPSHPPSFLPFLSPVLLF